MRNWRVVKRVVSGAFTHNSYHYTRQEARVRKGSIDKQDGMEARTIQRNKPFPTK